MLDGFPRTLVQAEALDRLLRARDDRLTAVIALDVARESLIGRITGRRIREVCDRVYHVESAPPNVRGRCDDDGSRLVQRPDAKKRAVTERLQEFEEMTTPLLDYYRVQGLLKEVDGNGDADAVHRSIVDLFR